MAASVLENLIGLDLIHIAHFEPYQEECKTNPATIILKMVNFQGNNSLHNVRTQTSIPTQATLVPVLITHLF